MEKKFWKIYKTLKRRRAEGKINLVWPADKRNSFSKKILQVGIMRFKNMEKMSLGKNQIIFWTNFLWDTIKHCLINQN